LEKNNTLEEFFFVFLIRISQAIIPIVILLLIERLTVPSLVLTWHRFALVLALYNMFDWGISSLTLMSFSGAWISLKMLFFKHVLWRMLPATILAFCLNFFLWNFNLNTIILYSTTSMLFFINRHILNVFITKSLYRETLVLLLVSFLSKVFVTSILKLNFFAFFISELLLLYLALVLLSRNDTSASVVAKQERQLNTNLIGLSATLSIALAFSERLFFEANFSNEKFVFLSFLATVFTVFNLYSSVFTTIVLKGRLLSENLTVYVYSLGLLILLVLVNLIVSRLILLFPVQLAGFNRYDLNNYSYYIFAFTSVSLVHAKYTSTGRPKYHVVSIIALLLLLVVLNFVGIFSLEALALLSAAVTFGYLMYDIYISKRFRHIFLKVIKIIA